MSRDPLAFAKGFSAISGQTFAELLAKRKANHEAAKARGVPLKTCPTCFGINYRAVKTCSLCLTDFPKRAKK